MRSQTRAKADSSTHLWQARRSTVQTSQRHAEGAVAQLRRVRERSELCGENAEEFQHFLGGAESLEAAAQPAESFCGLVRPEVRSSHKRKESREDCANLQADKEEKGVFSPGLRHSHRRLLRPPQGTGCSALSEQRAPGKRPRH